MFNFKKIASVLASAIMLSSTIGFAAAAAYPEPFVKGGSADAAVVWGANAAMTDLTAAIDLQQNLGALVTTGTTTTAAGVIGEAVPLFTGGTKLYINNSLNAVKTVLTNSEMPVTLKEESFSGNVDAKITQSVQIGPNPRVTFEKQPTSSQDPVFGIKTSTTNTLPMFNLTATFSKAVQFNHTDSEGETIRLFGNDYTVASSTDADTLILLKSAEKFSLDTDNNPTKDVTIEGSVYTVELVSTSDSAATIKVTDSAGVSNSKEISEAASKKVGAITIGIITADETNQKLSATVVAGTDKVTLEDGSSVTRGEDDSVIDGTTVEFGTGQASNLTSLTIQFDAPSSDKDSINAGESYIDPVFKSVKLDFAGNINIPEDSVLRESIVIDNSGDDKARIKFTEYRGNEISTVFAKNGTTYFNLMRDDDKNNITVAEGQTLNTGDYVVVGNEDDGYLLKLESTANSSTSGTSNDRARFIDVATSSIIDTVWSAEGTGTLTVGGISYTVTMVGNSDVATSETGSNVTLNYPDSAAQDMVVYPTIQTKRGAKVMFYEPLIINLSDWDGSAAKTGNSNQNVTTIRLPDGDGYEDISAITPNPTEMGLWNFTADGAVFQINTSAYAHGDGPMQNSSRVQIGKLYYNFTSVNRKNSIGIFLQRPGGANIGSGNWSDYVNLGDPAVVVWEEKDNNNLYQALVISIDNGVNADDGMGVNDVEDTWTNDSATWESQLYSNNKLYKQVDYWGSIITTDQSDTDQYKATISYPDEQAYANVYVAQVSSTITPGSASAGGGQVLIVKDSEVTSVAGKNLVVVGGSCINTVAAKILGSDSPLCTSDFTEKTGVGAGQYIIQSVKSPYSDEKIATLVAGYEADDTVNAVAKLLEGGVMTDSGTSKIYPITGTESGTETA